MTDPQLKLTSPSRYPAYVVSDDDRRRWDLCGEVARQDLGLPLHSTAVWHARRALYRSDIPTDEVGGGT